MSPQVPVPAVAVAVASAATGTASPVRPASLYTAAPTAGLLAPDASAGGAASLCDWRRAALRLYGTLGGDRSARAAAVRQLLTVAGVGQGAVLPTSCPADDTVGGAAAGARAPVGPGQGRPIIEPTRARAPTAPAGPTGRTDS